MSSGGSGTKAPGKDHWTAVYRTHPLRVYATEAAMFDNPELTRQELDLVEEVAGRLDVALASPILDLACGPGRHSLLLAERGHGVIGFDHSHGLLRIAAARGGAGRRPALVCGDLHRPPFADASFRTALLLGKSFGYFSDALNLAILRRTCSELRPGGFFGLELPDREPYLASMRPVEREEQKRENGDTLVSEYRCRWRAESRRLEVHEAHVLTGSGETFWEGVWDVRLYDADEVAALLKRVGFSRVAILEVSLVETRGAKGDVLMVGAVK